MYGICLSLSNLFYSAQYPLSPSMLLQMARFYSFFLWLSHIPLYIYTTSSLSTHLLMDRHLSCFYVLVIVNNATMNIWMPMTFWFGVWGFFGIYLKWIAGSSSLILSLLCLGLVLLPQLFHFFTSIFMKYLFLSFYFWSGSLIDSICKNLVLLSIQPPCVHSFFKKILFICFCLFIFRERGREGEREGEKLQCVVASCMPPYPQPRPWLGIELVTLWFIDRCSFYWATPARAFS